MKSDQFWLGYNNHHYLIGAPLQVSNANNIEFKARISAIGKKRRNVLITHFDIPQFRSRRFLNKSIFITRTSINLAREPVILSSKNTWINLRNRIGHKIF